MGGFERDEKRNICGRTIEIFECCLDRVAVLAAEGVGDAFDGEQQEGSDNR